MDNRCEAFCTDDLFLPNYARADGWRCGKNKDHANGHVLYSADGERRLPVMGWYVPKHRKNNYNSLAKTLDKIREGQYNCF